MIKFELQYMSEITMLWMQNITNMMIKTYCKLTTKGVPYTTLQYVYAVHLGTQMVP